MQSGLTSRRLTFREIFSSTMHFLALSNVTFVFLRLRLVGRCGPFASFYGGVAILDGGNTDNGGMLANVLPARAELHSDFDEHPLFRRGQ